MLLIFMGGLSPLPKRLRTSTNHCSNFSLKGVEMQKMPYGLEYLRKKLTAKQSRVNLRYQYYEMKNYAQEIHGIIPDNFKWLSHSLGWCAKAVDSLSDRLIFDEFQHDNFFLNEIFRLNHADIFFSSTVLSALIASCSFAYIGRDQDGYPSLQVIDGGNATGIIDPVTNLLTEGYAVLERDENDKPIREAYFQPFATDYYVGGKSESVFQHKAPYALLVPIINRPDAKRPFGHSRISRACMDITQMVLRTMLRAEVSSEFYSFPQKYILGLDADAEWNKRAATMSSFLNFGKGEDGGHPVLGQFSQTSMTPYTDYMRMLGSIFAGETGLTLDDLGFVTSNPSSEEAIKASHENLRLTARQAQRIFGTSFLNTGYLAACIRDNYTHERRAFANTNPSWLPIFELDISAFGAIGDAVHKINEAAPGFLGKQNLKRLTGLESDTDE